MLISFKTKNYKSFKNGFEFNMKPSRVRDLNHSLLKYNAGENTKKLLSSSVIYGPNAAGKTTIIEAFSRIKEIVLNGNIENPKINRSNMNSVNLELTPFIYNSKKEPVEFDINFEIDKIDYRYFLSIKLGNFLSKDEREILEEILEMDSKTIYIRKNKKINVFFKNIKKYLNEGLDEKLLESYDLIMNSNLESTKLFLSTEFRSLISKELYNKIYSWFDEKLLVINNFGEFKSVLETEKDEFKQVPKELYEAVNKIGVLATNMFYRKKDDNEIPVLLSGLRFNNGKALIPSRMIESVGTLHFIDLFPLLMVSLQEGATLIIDEMDASLHPMVVMSVVNLFHNPNINKNNAQLIFNTHNPIYLNNSVFRRDEMCFVEKDKDTKISDFYKLSDFMTNSGTSTRNTTDYINNYFKNKYGAIEYVDLSEIFEKPKKGEE